MLKDITLGQYFPGNSAIHRLDPRAKLIVLVAYIVALFTAGNWVSYGVVFMFLAVTVLISRIPLMSSILVLGRAIGLSFQLLSPAQTAALSDSVLRCTCEVRTSASSARCTRW